MAISYTREYEQLIIFDFKSDKSNFETVSKLLHEVNRDLVRVQEFILSKLERIENLADILDKLHFVEKEKIVLTNYHDNRELHDLLGYIEKQEVTYEDIINKNDKILVFYEKISPCRFIDKQLLRNIKKEGFDLVTKLLRELQHLATKPILKYLLELYDVYNDLLEIQDDLESKRQKFEQKLVHGQHKQLLQEIRQSKKNYSKDTILLLEGLLKTEGNYYHALKAQLDDQYNKIIQTKILQLNELVNYQDRVIIDERTIMGELKEYRKKYLRLQRYILV